MSANLMEYFNRQPRLGVLSTSSKTGEVNSAFIGSVWMISDSTVTAALGQNKTLANLRENPLACFIIIEPGKTLLEWKGLRIYLKMIACETSGETFDKVKAQLVERAGKSAARIIQAAVTFSVTGVRPLADFGQGWEKSI